MYFLKFTNVKLKFTLNKFIQINQSMKKAKTIEKTGLSKNLKTQYGLILRNVENMSSHSPSLHYDLVCGAWRPKVLIVSFQNLNCLSSQPKFKIFRLHSKDIFLEIEQR